MSWDLAIFRTKTNAVEFDPSNMDQIPEDLIRWAIDSCFPGTDTSDVNWMIFDHENASVEFSLNSDHYVDVYIQLVEDSYAQELLTRLHKLANMLGGKLFDFTTFDIVSS